MANIMIVDDHPAVRMAIGILLKNNGHNICAECDNGIDALAEVQRFWPDVLVLDLNLPFADGFDVLKGCKELCFSPQIIVLSEHDNAHTKARCLQLGVSAFVSKLDALSKLSLGKVRTSP